jgi:hypothetical protein
MVTKSDTALTAHRREAYGQRSWIKIDSLKNDDAGN